MRWWLPLKASTFAGPIDGLFLAILIITGIAFVLVEVGLIWFVIQYRQRPGRKAFYTHGNTRAEVIWTAIPAVTMVALGLISNHYWVEIKGQRHHGDRGDRGPDHFRACVAVRVKCLATRTLSVSDDEPDQPDLDQHERDAGDDQDRQKEAVDRPGECRSLERQPPTHEALLG